MTPPNILLIMSDQHNARCLGAEGHPFLRTPNLDRLAAEGTRFEAAYCPSPLCGPSRMSFLTGIYPCRSGIYANGQPLPPDLPTFAHAFGAAGYDTALAGRMHLTGADQHHGFEDKLRGDVTASTLGGGLTPLLDGLSAGGDADAIRLSGPGDSAYHHFDDEIIARALEWLRARPTGRPFLLVIGLALPHNPFVCAPEDFEPYRNRVRLPVAREAAAMPAFLRQRIERWRAGGVTPDDELRALAGYCGNITATDRRIGRLLDALDRAGRAGDTLVIYTSDHGESAGERGLWFKSNMYEGAARVPLLIRWPGRVDAGVARREAVNLVDIAPTLLDLADARQLPRIDGRSFRCLLEGRAAEWEDITFSEYGTRWGEPALFRMVRRGGWKYIWHDDGTEHLFHLADDPDETRDLARSPERGALRALAFDNWNPARIGEMLDEWKERNRCLFEWFVSRPRQDREIYSGPPGCNRLDEMPDFTPAPHRRVGAY